MEFIQNIIDSHNIPVLTAFLIGVLTSISPCPLATNITAVAYISKDVKTPKNTILKGLIYTLGRGVSYTGLSFLIYFGLSSFQISRIFQGWGNKVLGPILIVIGLVMLNVIKVNTKGNDDRVEKLKVWVASKGYLGAFFLGVLFALIFCPYSGVLFFGVLIPLILSSSEWFLLPPLYALGTGLPVIIFSYLIAFSLDKVSKAFSIITKIEAITRHIVAATFIIVGTYYLQYLLKYLTSINF